MLALTASAQLPPPRALVVRPVRPPITNYVSVTLAWSNSPSLGVVGTVLYCYTNGTLYGSVTNNSLTNSVVFPLTYVGASTHEGWTFNIVAFDNEGNVSSMSPAVGWHIPWLDYSELIINGTPPFQWTADLANCIPVQTTQSSFVWVNNGGVRFFRSSGITTVKPTIK